MMEPVTRRSPAPPRRRTPPSGHLHPQRHFVCGRCWAPIRGGDGAVYIVARDPRTGAEGGAPIEATPQAVQEVQEVQEHHEGPVHVADLLPAILSRLESPPYRIAFLARHYGCARAAERVGYPCELGDVQTFEAWFAWVDHVSRKPWMSAEDALRLASFFWTHQGHTVPGPTAVQEAF
jgi:hypothetical protein